MKERKTRPDLKATLSNTSDQKSDFDPFFQLQQWSNELSKHTQRASELFQALQALNIVIKDKNALKDLISSLAKLNQSQQKSQKSSSDQEDKKQSGEELIDLVNSPGMKEIVKEIMKSRGQKRRW